MPIKVIENEKPKLPHIKMTCDEAIDEKLEKIPAVKQCFSKNNVTLISGGMGSGKTTLTLQLMRGVIKNCYEFIYFLIPSQSFHSIPEKEQKYLKKSLVDDEGESTIIHEFDEDVLGDLYEKILDNANNGWKSLIIIDDYGAEFKRKPIELALKRIILKNRHLKCSLWLLTQNYYMMGKGLREIVNNIIMFNSSKSMNQKLFQEQLDIKEDQFNEVMRLLPTRHDYLLINLNYKKIYHNWNEIVVEDK